MEFLCAHNIQHTHTQKEEEEAEIYLIFMTHFFVGIERDFNAEKVLCFLVHFVVIKNKLLTLD